MSSILHLPNDYLCSFPWLVAKFCGSSRNGWCSAWFNLLVAPAGWCLSHKGISDRIRSLIKKRQNELTFCDCFDCPHSYGAVYVAISHPSGTSKGIKQMLFDTDMSFAKLRCSCSHTCVNTLRLWRRLSNQHLNIHVQQHLDSEGAGVLYGVLQGPKGARCLPDGPVSQPTEGSSGPFISSRLGCFRADKTPNICSCLCHQPSAPHLLDKTFHRLLLAFVLYSCDWKVPHHLHQHQPPDPSHCLFTAVTKGGN